MRKRTILPTHPSSSPAEVPPPGPCSCGDHGPAPDAGRAGSVRPLTRRGLLTGAARVGSAAVAVWAGGRLLAPSPAFAVAIMNPFAGYAVTGTWAEHLARGSSGGIDYGMGVGTALPASAGGTIGNIPENGTGGHTVTITHADGWKTQYMHLSAFSRSNGETVAQGDVVGLSGGAPGAPGSGSSTGPHVHWHMIDPSGVRRNPLELLGGGGGGGGLPKTSTATDGVPGTVFWRRVQNAMRIEEGYSGPIDGDPGVQTWSALQRHLAAHHGYGGPIDGVPGSQTYAALQRLAGAHGYTGPVDGAMGPESWRGVARWVNADSYD
ncbi:peptidoglycan DD-metalloendopeptidase family protein [Nocardioides alkalitolerans]|uniref:peptidoglycan DD-metalloendopeptidase family protein n=1 Tax=Nocardioides alkalitolerans TaxID=281714 RepID=UPI000A006206|nr:peptidoglycan DD-metalloendopeptidase family protein [Nocardioides alkalitolerans]